MKVTIEDQMLNLEDFRKVLWEDHQVEIGYSAQKRVNDCFEFLKEFTKGKLIYGINTGFGPMAQYRIEESKQSKLQYNLIRSHNTGMGKVIEPVFIKSIMLARLSSLLRGYSGVNSTWPAQICEYINKNILPIIHEHGSVGASGDLVQLAHLALALIGEGNVIATDGSISPISIQLKKHNLQPCEIYLREGLSIMNGTSGMTGIGMVNLLNSYNLFDWSVLASSMIVELVESFDDHYSYELNRVKHHNGQQYVAQQMCDNLIDSKLVKKRKKHHYDQVVTDTVLKEKMQEYYSLRCVPQILGPIYDTLKNAEKVLVNEVNSVNDNPIIDPENKDVFHGGNFHGDYVSLEMDKLKTAITKLSMLSERQLNYLLNDKLNNILPPFVNLGVLGFNLGMQGAQFVATSTVAENQTLSFPMYVHSIPNNNDNQDIVSMGSNAALITSKVIENTYQVLAVQFLTIIQAIDYLKIEDRLSSKSKTVYQQLRSLVPVFSDDTVLNVKIEKIKNFIIESPKKVAKYEPSFCNIDNLKTENPPIYQVEMEEFEMNEVFA